MANLVALMGENADPVGSYQVAQNNALRNKIGQQQLLQAQESAPVTNQINALKLKEAQAQAPYIDENAKLAHEENSQKLTAMKQAGLLKSASLISSALNGLSDEDIAKNYSQITAYIAKNGIAELHPEDMNPTPENISHLQQTIRIGKYVNQKSKATSAVTLSPGAQLYSQSGKKIAENTNAPMSSHNMPGFKDVNTADGIMVLDKATGEFKPSGHNSPAYDPELQQRVTEAKKTGANKADQLKDARSNASALNVYDTAMSGLKAAMAKTTTGPIVGRAPAFTAEQQIASGSVAAMAPVLKQLFRASGEGTFTDKDQELLLDMVPTRKDDPEAIDAKIKNIDAIVRSKLSAPSVGQINARMPQGSTKAGGKLMVDANGNKAMVYPDGSFEEVK